MADHPLTANLPAKFDVADEPYNLEMQPLEHPHAKECVEFLTADPETVAQGCRLVHVLKTLDR